MACHALAAVGYRFKDRFSLELGYRYLKEDYDNGPTFSFDAEMQGPILGLWLPGAISAFGFV